MVCCLAGSAMAESIAALEGAGGSGTIGGSGDPAAIVTAVTFIGSQESFLVDDGTGAMEVFKAPTGMTFTVGDQVSVAGTYAPFNSVPEVNPTSAATIISHNNPLPTVYAYTPSQLSAAALANGGAGNLSVMGHLVAINSATVSGAPTGTNYDGSNTPTGQTWTIAAAGSGMTEFYWESSFNSVKNSPGTYGTGLAMPGLLGQPVNVSGINMYGLVDNFGPGTPEFIPLFEGPAASPVPEPSTIFWACSSLFVAVGAVIRRKVSK